MPPSTRRPGKRLRSTATLPTPFCRLTTTTSGGACLAMISAMSAVSALLTVTSTTPASAKIGGIIRQREPVRIDRLIETFKARQPQAVGLDLRDHARARQQGDTAAAGHQHAADEAADAARPRHADRSARIHFDLLDCTGLR